MSVGNCSSCGASIIWAVTRNGRPIPIDGAPVLGGNLTLSPGPVTSPLATPVAARPDVTAYRAHFVSCPSGSKHRKGRHP